MRMRAIPIHNGGVASKAPATAIEGLQFIPIPSESASVMMPQLRTSGDYPHRYTLVTGNVSIYRIYCMNKNGAEPSGDGSLKNPYTSITKALANALCITDIAKCYWVQVVILSNSDTVNLFGLSAYSDMSRIILGSTDGTTFFNMTGVNSPFDGVISQCKIKGDIQAETLIDCRILEDSSVYCNYAINCKCSNAYSFYATHMHSCACDSSFQGATSMNKCKIKLNSSETEHNISRLVQYVYDSEIDATTEFVNYSLFTADFIVNSTFSGIKIRCNKLLENSSIAMNFGEHIQSGVGIWGVSGHGDVIVNMGNNSIVKDTTVTGKNKFKFTGSGRGYYGIIAVHSEQSCTISGLNISLSTSAAELGDFSGTNQHWSIISYTCAHALGTNPAKCVMGCDYKKVELHPEEGFDWAKPCTELYV